MSVPFVDLHPCNDPLIPQYEEKIHDILTSGNFILKKYTEEFEKKLTDLFGSKHALGVTSGTDALLLALMALDVKAGDFVIVPNYSFIATANVILRLGAQPVFIDIEPPGKQHSYQMCPKQLERCLQQFAITNMISRVKALIVVALYGYSPNMEAIRNLCLEYNVPMIEDIAQALGTTSDKSVLCGTFGTIACLSFYPTKNVGACGDAGALVYSDDELHHKLLALRNHGQTGTYNATLVGGNFRISEIQAAILTVKMDHIDSYLDDREQIASWYHHALKDVQMPEIKCDGDSCTLPDPDLRGLYRPYFSSEFNGSSWNQYVICFNRPELRTKVKAALDAAKVGNCIYYPIPLNRQSIFSKFTHDDTTEADHVAATCLALPIWPGLTVEQVQTVCDIIIKTIRS